MIRNLLLIVCGIVLTSCSRSVGQNLQGNYLFVNMSDSLYIDGWPNSRTRKARYNDELQYGKFEIYLDQQIKGRALEKLLTIDFLRLWSFEPEWPESYTVQRNESILLVYEDFNFYLVDKFEIRKDLICYIVLSDSKKEGGADYGVHMLVTRNKRVTACVRVCMNWPSHSPSGENSELITVYNAAGIFNRFEIVNNESIESEEFIILDSGNVERR